MSVALPPAASAVSNTPTVTVTVGPVAVDATVTATINRQDKAIAAVACLLNGTAVPCGAAYDDGTKVSTSQFNVTPPAGNNTVTVNVTLTDGGTAVGSVAVFQVKYPHFKALCTSWGGSYNDDDFTYEAGTFRAGRCDGPALPSIDAGYVFRLACDAMAADGLGGEVGFSGVFRMSPPMSVLIYEG